MRPVVAVMISLSCLAIACQPIEIAFETEVPKMELPYSTSTLPPATRPATAMSAPDTRPALSPSPTRVGELSATTAVAATGTRAGLTNLGAPATQPLRGSRNTPPPSYHWFASDVHHAVVPYPSHWQAVSWQRLEGPDGFLELLADNQPGELSAACSQHAVSYGSRPQISYLDVDGLPACLIMPSADQDPLLRGQAALIAEYPEPIYFAHMNVTYRLFVMLADRDHIQTMVAGLTFDFGPLTNYLLHAERSFDGRTVRIWRYYTDPDNRLRGIATLSIPGWPTEYVDRAVQAFGELPQIDVTGEGEPDVMLLTRGGGSHCCSGVLVYNLGSPLTRVLDLTSTTTSGTASFDDLDGDGRYEALTREWLTGFACSAPSAQAVLSFEPGRGYAPASPRFPAAYAVEIARLTEAAKSLAQRQGHTGVCGVLELTAAYLYSGQSGLARQQLDLLYVPAPGGEEPSADQLFGQIEVAVRRNALFRDGAP